MKVIFRGIMIFVILFSTSAVCDECTKDEIKLGLPECMSPKTKPIEKLENSVTLCSDSELTLASSQIYKKTTKLFSLCSDKEKSYVEYRYGSPEKVDFKYKSDDKNPKNIIYRGTYVGGSNQTTMFWFYNKDYLYRIEIPFTGVSKINVIQKTKKIAELKCNNNAEQDSLNIKHPFIKDKTSDEMFKIWNIAN